MESEHTAYTHLYLG